MERWYHIEYEDGSNPYICKNERELLKLVKKYGSRLIKVGDHKYKVTKICNGGQSDD